MGSCTNKWRVAELDVYIYNRNGEMWTWEVVQINGELRNWMFIYIIEMGKCGHGKLYK